MSDHYQQSDPKRRKINDSSQPENYYDQSIPQNQNNNNNNNNTQYYSNIPQTNDIYQTRGLGISTDPENPFWEADTFPLTDSAIINMINGGMNNLESAHSSFNDVLRSSTNRGDFFSFKQTPLDNMGHYQTQPQTQDQHSINQYSQEVPIYQGYDQLKNQNYFPSQPETPQGTQIYVQKQEPLDSDEIYPSVAPTVIKSSNPPVTTYISGQKRSSHSSSPQSAPQPYLTLTTSSPGSPPVSPDVSSPSLLKSSSGGYFDSSETTSPLSELRQISDWLKTNQQTEVELNSLMDTQRQYQNSIPNSVSDNLEQKYKNLKEKCEDFLTKIQDYHSTYIIRPNEQAKFVKLQLQFTIHLKQIEVCLAQLSSLKSSTFPIPSVAALVITKQPLPQSFFKSRPVLEPFEVTVLCGINQSQKPASHMKAFLIIEDYQFKNKNVIKIENDSAEVEGNLATFTNMKFSEGSEQKKVKLQFELQFANGGTGTGTGGLVSFRSDVSEPFIVLTHQSQWESSEGTLLKHAAFSGNGNQIQMQVSWPQFANALQRHYLRVTSSPRPLTIDDLRTLHAQIEYNPIISLTDFDKFWKWFGKVLYRIRTQKNLQLWGKGLIYGFISKKDSNNALQDQPAGTFLVRFSERNAGQFAIAWVKDKKVHHYLLSDEDQKKPLPDFLSEKNSWENVLRVFYDPQTGTITTSLYSKDAMLEEFGTTIKDKKNKVKMRDGYEANCS